MKKSIKTRLICSLMAIITLITNFSVVWASENDYADVINYYPYNSWATKIGEKYKLIFLENNTRESKRYEVAVLLYDILDLTPMGKTIKFNDLDDVESGVKSKINSIAENNIVLGYDDGSFKPNNDVTRAEFVTMLDKSGILDTLKKDNVINFSDTENHWAKKSIEYVSSLGIVTGRDDNLFCPDAGITPQEILVIMDRLVNNNCISSEDLISAMKATFKCKEYTDKEQYIIEVMYDEYDTVQGFMKYAFPYKQYYDYTNGNEYATKEDLQNVSYFMMSYNTQLLDSGETRDLYNKIGEIITSNKISSGEIFTIRDYLLSIGSLQNVCRVGMYGYGSSTYAPIPVLEFSNKDEFNEKEMNAFKVTIGNNTNKLVVNNEMYFPLDAPITKYMLNYFVMKLEDSYNSYRKTQNNSLYYNLKILNTKETDISKLPSNYYEYPYIIKDIPKELYEQPYIYSDKFKVITPIQCYHEYADEVDSISSYANTYYELILNIDYRTLDEEEFKSRLSNCFYYISDDEIDKYIQYVKDNEIIIEGKGAVISGTFHLVDGTAHMKSIAQFKIISAKNMKNLLFGDLDVGLGYDIEYTKNEYTLYPDIEFWKGPYIYNDKLTTIRKLAYRPLYRGVDWYSNSHKL